MDLDRLFTPTQQEIDASKKRIASILILAEELGARTDDEIAYVLDEAVLAGDLSESEQLTIINRLIDRSNNG